MVKYGFLGMGIMGTAMAANLLKAGFEVMVWNRRVEKCRPLVDAGALQGQSPRQVVEECEVTFAMLSDPRAAHHVCFGDDGVLEGLSPGKGYVDMSTVDEETSRQIESAVIACRGRYLEAPVSGSKKPAEDGTLVILAAGDESLYHEVTPAFEVMGKKRFFLGDVGQGARMKLVVNMIMGGMMTIFAEGLALAQKADLKPEELIEVLGAGAMANPMFQLKGSLILQDDFTVNFPLKHMQKDLRLALALGDHLGQPMYTAAASNESFKKACGEGLEDEDFSAVVKVVRE